MITLLHAGPLGHLHPVDLAALAAAALVGAIHIVTQVKAQKKKK
jgi:hypothetical protein